MVGRCLPNSVHTRSRPVWQWTEKKLKQNSLPMIIFHIVQYRFLSHFHTLSIVIVIIITLYGTLHYSPLQMHVSTLFSILFFFLSFWSSSSSLFFGSIDVFYHEIVARPSSLQFSLPKMKNGINASHVHKLFVGTTRTRERQRAKETKKGTGRTSKTFAVELSDEMNLSNEWTTTTSTTATMEKKNGV